MKACLFTDQKSGPSPTEFILLVSSQNLDRAVSCFLSNVPAPLPTDRTLAKIFPEVTGAFHKKTIFEARRESKRKPWRQLAEGHPVGILCRYIKWIYALQRHHPQSQHFRETNPCLIPHHVAVQHKRQPLDIPGDSSSVTCTGT